MRQITFSEADVQAIACERYHHPDPRVQRHMEVLWLKHHGFTHEEIATRRCGQIGRPVEGSGGTGDRGWGASVVAAGV